MAKFKAEGGNGKRPTKSDAIREMLALNPQASSKDVVAALSEKGIKVAQTLVYYIKSKQKHEKKIQKRQRAAETSRTTGTANPVQLIIKCKELAREAGGMRYLKQLVDVLAE